MHRLKNVKSNLGDVLRRGQSTLFKEAEDKEPMEAGTVYMAPSNYHLLVERNFRLSLSVSELVHFSRPSIDETFYSIGEVFGSNAMGIILTGANADGAEGLKYLEKKNAPTIVQNPQLAQVSFMPKAALTAAPKSQVLSLAEIAQQLMDF